MAGTKVDLGAVANQGINTAFNWLNKLIGSGGSPLNKTVPSAGQVKVGNVGGIFGINLNWTTIALIGVGLIGVVFLVKKLK
jgi:hypothetical protein